ncbi:MAG: 30S ribosomal protein S4, partial [FCB group bacterium]|nr:30S ribosomal protein S4 [FCB group bacterium]
LKNDSEIKVREKSKRIPIILDSVKRIKGDHTLPWLAIDKAKLVGVFMRTPERNEVPEEFNEQLVVELYSK